MEILFDICMKTYGFNNVYMNVHILYTALYSAA